MTEFKKIFLTQPTLPPFIDFVKHLEIIWKSKWITNYGVYHTKFEKALCDFLSVENCSLCSNGTTALMVGLKALDVSGEVITTPFSFVATTHAIHWNGAKPVFCDIEEYTYNINPDKIESLITSKTTAILPVHVYGNPCDVKAIEDIANDHDLKVIYDAAHAFYSTINDTSVLQFGDMSIVSFHATKVFNTIEGGAVFTQNIKLKNKIDLLCNFGFSDKISVEASGLNGKMNELQAAYGLLSLQIIEEEIQKRRKIAEYYKANLSKIPGIKILNEKSGTVHSHAYFPILIDRDAYGKSRDELYHILEKYKINTRKYFYPLISHFKPYKKLPSASSKNLKVAEEIARKVLCLPIYGELSIEEIDRIIEIIQGNIK